MDESVLRAVRVRAARSGKGVSEVIEKAVREKLGLDVFVRMWERSNLREEEGTALAVEAQHATRAP